MPQGSPLTILLVEDNADHAELVKRSLKHHQVANQVFHVSDGEAALDFLHQRGSYAEGTPRPHVILLDLRLPRIDGLRVLEQIRATKAIATIPVVILTTSNAESDIAQAYQVRANSYIVKPLDYSRYASLMNDLGFYWLSWNQYPWSGSSAATPSA